MIERSNAPGLSQPPGYSHVVVASGRRLVSTAGAASTLLGVSMLAIEGQLVEIEAIAVLE